MARLIYACRFDLPSTLGTAPVLGAYRDWIGRHYRVKRALSGFTCDFSTDMVLADLPSGHSLKSSRHVSDAGEATLIEWAYPDDHDDTLRWRTEIRVGGFDGSCSVEHLIWIESVDYQVAPVQFALGSPKVIRRLCSDQVVHVGDMRIRATPYPLGVSGVGDFLALLASPLRKLPIVLLAPYASDDPNLINAGAMAERLAGVAVVVVADSTDATWDIGDALGRTLSCFNGAARIYWPGFKVSDDPRRHPLYLGVKLEAAGPDAISRSIERSIFAVASFRFVPDVRITEIVRSAEHASRVAQLESLRASTGADWGAYAIELDRDLSAAKQKLSELEAENENLRANQQIFFAADAPGEVANDVSPEEIVVPETVRAAVEFAREKCSNLIVLESALHSAESSPFQRPAEIADALRDLDQVAERWRALKAERGNGGDLRQHLAERGWGKRCSMHISDTTRSRYGTDYTFTYEAVPRFFEPHITVGSGDANSCASIHFMLDEGKGKIVVAHVGRHLRNTKT